MSKRRPARSVERATSPAVKTVAVKFHPIWLIYIAVLLMGFGGGMLYDRAGNVSDPISLLYHQIIPVIYILVSLAVLLTIFLKKAPFRNKQTSIMFAILFILWSALFIFSEANRFIGLTVWSQFVTAVSLAWILYEFRDEKDKVASLILLVIAASTLIAMFGVNEYLTHFSAGNKNWRVFGNFVNPDFLAGYLIMSIPLTLAMHLGFDIRRFAQSLSHLWGYLIVLMGMNVGGVIFLAYGTGSILYYLHAGPILFTVTLSCITLLLAAFLLQGLREHNASLFIGRMIHLWCVLSLLLQSVCLLLTQSRFGLAAFLLEMAYFAVLLFSRRQLQGESMRRAIRITVIVAILGIAAVGPVWLRLRNAESEAYSLNFRIYTWRGALRMAEARIFTGFGPGSFDDKYQRFAYVGYTQHAHGGFLQLLAETGIVGLILFAGVYAVSFLKCTKCIPQETDTNGWFQSPLILAGISAALVGAFLHNLVDSDLYVPVSCLLLGVLFGLVIALSPERTEKALEDEVKNRRYSIQSFGAFFAGILVVSSGVVMIFSASNLLSRNNGFQGETAILQGNYPDALASYQKAAEINPLNPKYGLRTAALLDAMGETGAAENTFTKLERSIPIAKVFFLAGQFYQRHSRLQDAIREFAMAKSKDPHNLENLTSLADTLEATGRTAEAEAIYRELTRLYASPVGRIKAIPELPDWQYPIGFLGLAKCEIAEGKSIQAERNLEMGLKLCKQFWHVRNQQVFQISIKPDILREFVSRYEWGLNRLADIRKTEGRIPEADGMLSTAQQVESELPGALKKLMPMN